MLRRWIRFNRPGGEGTAGAFERSGAHRRAFGGISAIPSTFLIDRSGVVRHRVVGYFAPPALRVPVNRLMAEEVSEAAPPSEEAGGPVSGGRGGDR
jgi:hypothetical protein